MVNASLVDVTLDVVSWADSCAMPWNWRAPLRSATISQGANRRRAERFQLLDLWQR